MSKTFMNTQVHLEDQLVEQGLALTGLAHPEELVDLALRELVARRTREARAAPVLSAKAGRQPGSAKGKLRVLEDDDAHLEDFRDYMP
jgi:hypothetical protein